MNTSPLTLTQEALQATLRDRTRGSPPILSAEALGSIVRDRRRELDLSQAEVAGYAGVGRRFIGELEEGKPTLRLDKALKVLQALGITIVAIA